MSDLNLLKSWNPKLSKNRKKVWQAQQDLLEENRKIKERQKEIEKEKELNKLTSLSRDYSKASKKSSGLEWMYEDAKKVENTDDYLLGRKQLKDAIQNINPKDKNELPKASFTQNAKSNRYSLNPQTESFRFTNSKQQELSNDDPMTKIRNAQLAKRTNTSTLRTDQYNKRNNSGHHSKPNDFHKNKVYKSNNTSTNISRYRNRYSSQYFNPTNKRQ